MRHQNSKGVGTFKEDATITAHPDYRDRVDPPFTMLEATCNGEFRISLPSVRDACPGRHNPGAIKENTMKKKKLRTHDEAKEYLRSQGLTAAAWARANGFPVRVVQEVLRDRAKGNYGVAHNVAVALGIKAGEMTATEQSAGGTA